jgi:anti-sigma factor ChrR (cupin superfamily)
MMAAHPPRAQLLAYCQGTANAVAVWVMECHLLLCRQCRDSVAEIDTTPGGTQRRYPGVTHLTFL